MGEGNPNIDRLIVIEKARRNEWRYMKDLLLGIRRERYDVVINSQGQMIGLLTCLLRRPPADRLRLFPWRLGHKSSIVRFRHDTEHQGNSTLGTTGFHCSAFARLASEDRNYYLWLQRRERQRGRGNPLAAGVDPTRPPHRHGVNRSLQALAHRLLLPRSRAG